MLKVRKAVTRRFLVRFLEGRERGLALFGVLFDRGGGVGKVEAF